MEGGLGYGLSSGEAVQPYIANDKDSFQYSQYNSPGIATTIATSMTTTCFQRREVYQYPSIKRNRHCCSYFCSRHRTRIGPPKTRFAITSTVTARETMDVG